MSALSPILRDFGHGKVAFWCAGCECAHALPVAEPSQARWEYNGNPNAPTFHPSILVRYYKCTVPNVMEWFRANPGADRAPGHDAICHSFVVDGQIQYLGDCTHHLAGRTLPLPAFP